MASIYYLSHSSYPDVFQEAVLLSGFPVSPDGEKGSFVGSISHFETAIYRSIMMGAERLPQNIAKWELVKYDTTPCFTTSETKKKLYELLNAYCGEDRIASPVD